MSDKFWASVLLHDNKIKFWKVSSNKKSCVEDFYKDFHYSGEDMMDFIDDHKCKVESQRPTTLKGRGL